jgi:hypothetical protein
MATPRKQQIYEEATRLYVQHELRNGNTCPNTPEYSELLESGFISLAQSNLMSTPETLYGLTSLETEKTQLLETSHLHFNVEELLASGCFISGQSGCGKSDLAMYVADKLMEQGVVVYCIDPSQDWMARSNVPHAVTIERASQPITIPEQSTIFDTSRLYVSEQRRFIEAFAERLYRFQLEQPRERRKWRTCVFEECQLVYPNGSFRSHKKSASLQLVSVGRNFKLRFIAVTPFAANVDKYPIKMAAQRFFGSTSEHNDLRYLQGFLGERVYELTRLDSGQFVYHYPKKKQKISKVSIDPHNRTVPLRMRRPEAEAVTVPKRPQPLPRRSSDNESLMRLLTALTFLAIVAVVL